MARAGWTCVSKSSSPSEIYLHFFIGRSKCRGPEVRRSTLPARWRAGHLHLE